MRVPSSTRRSVWLLLSAAAWLVGCGARRPSVVAMAEPVEPASVEPASQPSPSEPHEPSAAPEPPAEMMSGLPAWLGVTLNQVAAGEVVVEHVVRGSPAALAGVQEGDRVRHVAGVPIREPGQVTRLVAATRPGSNLILGVQRGEPVLTLNARVEARPSARDVLRLDHLGQPLPNGLPWVPLGRAPRDLRALKGKVVLIDFWAMWCGPCRYSMPHLAELARRRRPEGFEVIGVSPDDPIKSAALLQKLKIDYPQWHDAESRTQGQLGVHALPTLFLLDRQGLVREIWVGVADPERLEAVISELLREP